MTGGVVAVLGKTGRNFVAGMSGGTPTLDEAGDFASAATWRWSSSTVLEETTCRGCHHGGDIDHKGRSVQEDMNA